MKKRLQQLSPRERSLLLGGIAVLLISGLYAFTYMPIIEGQQRIRSAIDAQQQLNVYLQGVAAETGALQANSAGSAEVADTAQSLIGIIDAGSEQSGIKPAVKRLVPEDQDKVSLWLEQCEFDKLVAWLALLDTDHAITVQQMTISREPGSAGLISGKVLLGK